MHMLRNNSFKARSVDFIHRLGYREINKPMLFHCIRNQEPLMLKVYYLENERKGTVVYYTEAEYIPTGQLRHTCIFLFDRNKDHERLHKVCLYTLFLDEKITRLFEEQNKWEAPPHLDKEKAEIFQNWVRFYWNTGYFNDQYALLGGLQDKQQLL